MNTPAIMRLLYGTEAPRCALCRITLQSLEESRTATHPTNPTRSVAYCAPCWTKKQHQPLQRSQSELCIRIPPETADCGFCGETFKLPPYIKDEERKHHRFCSIVCFNADMFGAIDRAKGGQDKKKGLQRVRSYRSAGACDCEDYHNRGYCTMTFQAGSP
jgi:hypothetical protein